MRVQQLVVPEKSVRKDTTAYLPRREDSALHINLTSIPSHYPLLFLIRTPLYLYTSSFKVRLHYILNCRDESTLVAIVMVLDSLSPRLYLTFLIFCKVIKCLPRVFRGKQTYIFLAPQPHGTCVSDLQYFWPREC